MPKDIYKEYNSYSQKKSTSYFIIVFYLTCYNLSAKCEQRIILKTNVTGYVQIISENFNNPPDEVIINGNNYTPQKGYYLNDSESEIKLIWNSEITDISKMFQCCSNITEI